MKPEIGATVAHYRILEQLGSGGMGVVYLADDLKLHRKVALKFLTGAAQEAHADARLQREAAAASALDHPNVATVYEIGEWEGATFVAMAYYAGETLRERLARGPLPVDEAAAIVGQIADGLAAAHAVGVIHRDLKPANIIITTSGQVKILDFGLAKRITLPDETTMLTLTQEGSILGTPAYMSPEQIRGADVDARADVWALGVVAYELVTGRRPFDADSIAGQAVAMATVTPEAVRRVRPDVPAEFERVITAALNKDAERRTITAMDVAQSLRAFGRRTGETDAAPVRRRRRTLLTTSIALVVIVGGVVAWRLLTERSERSWARTEAVAQITDFADHERFIDAFELLGRVRRHLDPQAIDHLSRLIANPMTIGTTPAGATVSYAEYGSPESARRVLGTTPLENVLVPRGPLVWHAEKAGFVPFEDVRGANFAVTLDEIGKVGPGMVRALAVNEYELLTAGTFLPPVTLPAFLIGRHEVTNREYQAFVEAGGYSKRDYWKHEFKGDGRSLSWEAGIALFRDVTGQAGPAAWELSRYPAGQDDFPVTGVSWFEAAAYAVFAGASLPTMHHFRYVAGPPNLLPLVVPFAVYSRTAPLAVATSKARHRFGAFDLAGNVKEWSLTKAEDGRRFTLGGGWDEPPYMFATPDPRSPFERSANLGFRLAQYAADDPTPVSLAGPLLIPREFVQPRPAPDQVYEAYARAFAYDRMPLTDVKSERVDDSPVDWTRETVSLPAAYGRERVIVHVLIPKRGRPPYQPVIFVQGGNAWAERSSQNNVERPVAGFLARSGRALVIPILKGTFERYDGNPEFNTSHWRDLVVADSKDIGRVVDYLVTRPDLDRDHIGYLGYSRGASYGALWLAMEKRIKAAVFWNPGFYQAQTLPDVNLVHFVPRMTQPVLLLNGRLDAIFPEASSEEFFRALGTPPALKERTLYDVGHNLPVNERVMKTIEWFNRQLGAVK